MCRIASSAMGKAMPVWGRGLCVQPLPPLPVPLAGLLISPAPLPPPPVPPPPSRSAAPPHPPRASFPESGQVELGRVQERGRLLPGQVFNDEAVASPETASLKASLVASSPNTTLIMFSTNDVERVVVSALMGCGRRAVCTAAVAAAWPSPWDWHAVVGQFL